MYLKASTTNCSSTWNIFIWTAAYVGKNLYLILNTITGMHRLSVEIFIVWKPVDICATDKNAPDLSIACQSNIHERPSFGITHYKNHGSVQNMRQLTHWGRVTHICVSDLTNIGSDNGLSPGRRQAIIRTNAGILLKRPSWTNFSEFLVEFLIFSFKKMRLKVSSAKRRPFCLGPNELKANTLTFLYSSSARDSGAHFANNVWAFNWNFVTNPWFAKIVHFFLLQGSV